MPSARNVISTEIHSNSSEMRGSCHLQGLTVTLCSCCWGFQVYHDILKEFESCHTYLGTLPMDYLEQCHPAVMDQCQDLSPGCRCILLRHSLSLLPHKVLISHRRVLGGLSIIRYVEYWSEYLGLNIPRVSVSSDDYYCQQLLQSCIKNCLLVTNVGSS